MYEKILLTIIIGLIVCPAVIALSNTTGKEKVLNIILGVAIIAALVCVALLCVSTLK